MQETRVWSLIFEDQTCHEATKPMWYNCWACAPEPGGHNYWAHMLQLLKPVCPRARASQQEKPWQREGGTSQLESSPYLPQLEKTPRAAVMT